MAMTFDDVNNMTVPLLPVFVAEFSGWKEYPNTIDVFGEFKVHIRHDDDPWRDIFLVVKLCIYGCDDVLNRGRDIIIKIISQKIAELTDVVSEIKAKLAPNEVV